MQCLTARDRATARPSRESLMPSGRFASAAPSTPICWPDGCAWRFPRARTGGPSVPKKAIRAVLEEIGAADALLARQDDSSHVILIDRHLRGDVIPAPHLGGTPVTALDFRPRWIRQTLAGHQAASLSCHWPFSIHP